MTWFPWETQNDPKQSSQTWQVKSEGIFVPRNFPGISQKQPLREKEAGGGGGEGAGGRGRLWCLHVWAGGGLMGEQGCPLAWVWAWLGGSLSSHREQVLKSPPAPPSL